MFLLNKGWKHGFEDCSENGTSLIEWTIFTCGFSPGLRTGSVQWKNSDYLLFQKITRPLTEAGYIKQKVWKTKLEIFAIPWNLKKWQVLWKPILWKILSDRVWVYQTKSVENKIEIFAIPWNQKDDKSCGNQYLECFRLTEAGYTKQKVWKSLLEIFAIPSNQKIWQVLWKPILRKILSDRGLVYQTKSVENKTWNICNSLKSEKITIFQILISTLFVWNTQPLSDEKNSKYWFPQDLSFFLFQGIANISNYVFHTFC